MVGFLFILVFVSPWKLKLQMYVYSSVNCAKKNVYHPLDVTEFYYNYAVKQLMVIWRVDLIKRRWRSTVGAVHPPTYRNQ